MTVIVCICVLFLLSFYQTVVSTSEDSYLIDCGSKSNTTVGERIFTADTPSSYMSIATNKDIFANTANSNQQVPSGIYLTARVFTQKSSYTFSIGQQGRHWVRLHFFPFSYQKYNLTSAIFSIATQDFGLLYNFQIQNSSFVMKEYLINVTEQTLVLTFIPSNNSFAFVNAIEVVSVPDTLVSDTAQAVPLPNTYNGLSEHAFETIYRINMGGPLITPDNDTLGRFWDPDTSFLASISLAQNSSIPANNIVYQGLDTNEIAPNIVYATAEEMAAANVTNPNFNISWLFTVDPDYQYFIRMHFCDIVSIALNELYFNVYINNDNVISNFDISAATQNTLAAAYYRDFVVLNTPTGSKNLAVKVGPAINMVNVNPNAILNGLEIMKMSNSNRSLDGSFSPNSSIRSKRNSKVGLIVGSVAGFFVALGLLMVIYFFCCRRSQKLSTKPRLPLPLHGGHSETKGRKGSKVSAGSPASPGPSNQGWHFTFAEIEEATKNFDESLVLGVGGFGKVFTGMLADGTKVAVKRGNRSSEQGMAEFRTEIEMLSKLRHRHLVSLIGYCEEHSEMILVYEYLAYGTLRNHLYGSDLPPMSWKQRLNICIGAARGFHYLHRGAEQGIIHRDVKTTNILLDENFVAKVADFGLSKTGTALDQTHVSTAVKGSFGYIDPEYFRRQQLTEKSDVYSFGVVLMEVLCARPVIDPSLPRDKINIAEWALHWHSRGMLDQIIDRHLVDSINLNSLRMFGETAAKCLAEQAIERPTMGDVLWNLEYALQLQGTAMLDDPDENSANRISEIPLLFSQEEHFGSSTIERDSVAAGEKGSEGATASTVLSRLVNHQGR